MKPGYDSRPNVPAATPKRDAVRFRIFEMVYSGNREHLCRADVDRGVGDTWALCCTLACTIGLTASSLSSSMMEWTS